MWNRPITPFGVHKPWFVCWDCCWVAVRVVFISAPAECVCRSRVARCFRFYFKGEKLERLYDLCPPLKRINPVHDFELHRPVFEVPYD